jgi:hypothetical protein
MNWRVKNKREETARYYLHKGITVCEEWKRSFPAFLQHVGPMPKPGLTLDRINGDKNYEPGNVRWATWKQQLENRSKAR